MGWASGSSIAEELVKTVRDNATDERVGEDVGEELRQDLYRKLISVFENYDCDTLDECLDLCPDFDKVYKETHDHGY